MSELSSLIVAFGYLGVAAAVFAESGLFFGFFLPGDSLLFTAGFLASQGAIGIVPLIFLTTVAAVAGNSAGYWFGRKVGPHLFNRPDSFWFSQKRVEDAHRFFEKNGAKSIILARFIPAVRTFTPIVAGIGGMRYRPFSPITSSVASSGARSSPLPDTSSALPFRESMPISSLSSSLSSSSPSCRLSPGGCQDKRMVL